MWCYGYNRSQFINTFVKTSKTYIPLIFTLALILMSACLKPAPAMDIQAAPPGTPDRVDVVYFYDSKICQCQAVPGEHIQSTLLTNFLIELTSGKLTFQSIDLNDPNGAAIANKYGATSLSLFVDVVRGDTEHIVPIPEIVLVKDDNEALDKLVIDRISKYLTGEE
jgi:hypothetical protein